MRTLRELHARVLGDADSLRLRVEEHDVLREPACAAGEKVFVPDTTTSFLLDRLQDAGAAINCQYVVRDNITYEIPVIFPPPGVFEARFLRVNITQRLFSPTAGVGQIFVPMNPALSYENTGFGFADAGGVQTVKWSVAPNRFVQFFWNIIEGKSGRQLSDEMIPDAVLLPALAAATSLRFGADTSSSLVADSGDVGLELDAPWLFERDADIRFLWRPITPIIQPAANSGFSPYSFDDREVNNSIRNSSVSVAVELHGGRIYDDSDAQRQGARLDAVDDPRPRGGFG